MKHLKIALLALLLIAVNSNSNAQDKENPWMLTFGTNAIDISTPTDAKSGYFGSFDYDGNNLHILPWLSRVSAARYLDKGFSLELAGSYNKVDKPWGAGTEVTHAAVDLNVKYDLNSAFGETGWFDPFLYVGVGENWLGSKDGIGFNFGAGFNAWFNKSLGINVTSGYKKVNTPVDFKMFQHSVGLTWRFGKTDSDGDGIRNREDKCPDVVGTAELEGCADTDKDNDGIMDCCDDCPDVFGVAAFCGCPDTDGDGVPDSEDECPTVAGPKRLNGCPDQDGDGVADKNDGCPTVPGPTTNAGCPFKDTDGDGVIDLIDNCVTIPGPAKNHGCPEDFKDASAVDLAAKGINFDTGKYNIRPDIAVILNQVAEVLKTNDNLQFRFTVNGHTDSVGNDASNLLLSKNRANSVREYLIAQGVNPNRLSTQGFGEEKPIDTNETPAGRLNNRRVEIKEVR